MDYKIKNICEAIGCGVSKFYKLKEQLDKSIPEQNRIEYYYNKGRNFYITEKGYNWFIENFNNINYSKEKKKDVLITDISIYQNQIIDIYKQRIEYLELENKRLLDIIAVKEQKEIAKDFKSIDTSENKNILHKFFDIFKNH